MGTIASIKAEISNMLHSHSLTGSYSSRLLQGKRHESRQNGKILAKICSIFVKKNYLTMIHSLDSQLGIRITRNIEVHCAS